MLSISPSPPESGWALCRIGLVSLFFLVFLRSCLVCLKSSFVRLVFFPPPLFFLRRLFFCAMALLSPPGPDKPPPNPTVDPNDSSRPPPSWHRCSGLLLRQEKQEMMHATCWNETDFHESFPLAGTVVDVLWLARMANPRSTGNIDNDPTLTNYDLYDDSCQGPLQQGPFALLRLRMPDVADVLPSGSSAGRYALVKS